MCVYMLETKSTSAPAHMETAYPKYHGQYSGHVYIADTNSLKEPGKLLTEEKSET